MSPPEGLVKELDEKNMELIVKFIGDIRNGKMEGSNKLALETVNLLEQIISETQNATGIELSAVIRSVGKTLSGALPEHLVVSNMVRRVLRAIRDECRTSNHMSSEGAGESLQRLVLATSRRATLGPDALDLREPIRDHIAELRSELETSSATISTQARSLLHPGELVLTYGASQLAEKFLKHAAVRGYRLVMAEGTTPARSHAMAARLTAAGVPVTVITSAAVFGVMSRVNKVIVSVGCGLGGGAVLGAAGLHTVTTAAQHYRVPVIALCPLYKLCPLYASQQNQLDCLTAPHHALPYESSESASCSVLSPKHDLVPPDHISLFVTNLGGSSPSYVYRLLSELYDPNDYQL